MDQPKYRIEIFWSDEDGRYIANVPDLRYCSAFGESYEDALREVLVAMQLHLDALREEGRPIPEAKSRRVVEVNASAEDPNQLVDIQWINEEGVVSTFEAVESPATVQKSSMRLSRKFFENWIETLEEHFREIEEQDQPDATDAARQKAAELGVDLSQIKGTGSEGRILLKDVMNAAHRD